MRAENKKASAVSRGVGIGSRQRSFSRMSLIELLKSQIKRPYEPSVFVFSISIPFFPLSISLSVPPNLSLSSSRAIA